MDTLKRSIDAAAGSVQAGAQQMEFLRATSQRLGLDLATTTKGYAGFLAATTAAGKSTAVAQEIFRTLRRRRRSPDIQPRPSAALCWP